jgi:hypothetical protein
MPTSLDFVKNKQEIRLHLGGEKQKKHSLFPKGYRKSVFAYQSFQTLEEN